MSDSPVTRGSFLRSFASSLPGLALGTGVAAAAQAVARRVTLLTDESIPTPLMTPLPAKPIEPPAEIPFHRHGPPEGNRIALTFDDGPTPGVTDRILDALRQRNLHATFFMIGERIVAAPELARRVRDSGHEIANHSFTHPKLTDLPDSRVAWELQRTEDVIAEVLDVKPTWFRPPYGEFRQNQAAIPQSMGLGICLLDVDSRDWAVPPESEIVSAILSKTQPGSIVLCHDMHPPTANCIGEFLDGLLARGFQFATVSDLLGQPHLNSPSS